MGFLDVITGRRKPVGPAPDRLFAMSTAYVKLETELEITTRGSAAIVSCALAYYARGGLELDSPRMLRDYDRALELDPSLLLVRRDREETRRLANDVAGAEGDRDALVERTPASPIGWTLRGRDRMNARDFAGARADLTHAVLIAPGYPPGWAWCGRNEMLDPDGDRKAALRDLTRAIELDPANADAREALAELTGPR